MDHDSNSDSDILDEDGNIYQSDSESSEINNKDYYVDTYDYDDSKSVSDPEENNLEEKKNGTKHGKRKTKHKVVTEKLLRTIFVGNLPQSITKKTLIQHFSQSPGSIESVRFRGAQPQSDEENEKSSSNKKKMPMTVAKRLAVQKKSFSSTAFNLIAYVVFKSADSVPEALKLNGSQLGDNVLRVDRALTPKNSIENSLFVGNLPRKCQEDEVRAIFAKFGGISNIRLVRDRDSGLVKGFGFVEFVDSAVVPSALKLNEKASLHGRVLRVKLCSRKSSLGGDGGGRGGGSQVSKRPPHTASQQNKRKVPSSLQKSKHPGSTEKRLLKKLKRKRRREAEKVQID